MKIYETGKNVYAAVVSGKIVRVQRVPAKSKDGRGRPSYRTFKRGKASIPEGTKPLKAPSKLLLTAIKNANKETI